MKTNLPIDHKLSVQLISNPKLMPRSGGAFSITDAQYAALEAGVGAGKSLLISAPTSTGKTLIGWWAAAAGLEREKRVVYLVSHRALAAQKFDEIKQLFLQDWLSSDATSLICATGDGVHDATSRASSSPLTAKILVATYEKYLALMSAGGPPQDLSDIVFVCDEVQLIGDETRGKHVELLFSVLKRTGWHQFVGLSAVMDDISATQFADWLGLKLVKTASREKSIKIEARSPTECLIARSMPDGKYSLVQAADVKSRNLNQIIAELLAVNKSPVIVFCMKVDDTYECCKSWADSQREVQQVIVPATVDLDQSLHLFVNKRCAFHNAELNDDERRFVEELISDNKVDVVFATSTLAAGVNFPLASAVFSKWKRWDFDKKAHVPIRRDEFQNMAGRVGRMGQAAGEGTVIATAANAGELNELRALMDFSKKATLGVGITPNDFSALIVQLFAGGLCTTRREAFELVSSTLSAQREAEKGRGNVKHWQPHLDAQIDRLVETHCLVETSQKLTVTEFGRAVAKTGLKPETAEFFLNYLNKYAKSLVEFLPTPERAGRDDDLLFVFVHGSLLSPEFNKVGGSASRHLHWRLENNGPVKNPFAERLSSVLFERPWVADPHAANGARVVSEWAFGSDRESLEAILPSVRIGTIQSTARDVSWLLSAIAQVISAASSPALADEARHPLLKSTNPNFEFIRMFARVLSRYALRVAFGLPSECHWMRELELDASERKLSRKQIISLHQYGLSRPHILMDGSPQYDVLRQKAVPITNGVNYPNLVRDATKRWKVDQRAHFKTRHTKIAKRYSCDALVSGVYTTKDKALESALRDLFADIGIPSDVLDAGGKQSWPDFKFLFQSIGLKADLVCEVKSKEKDTSLVPLVDAVKVLSSSELAGLAGAPCLTICSPGVEPSVPTSISGCRRLTIVEIVDLAEAYLRVKEGHLTLAELHNWLTTPGLALIEDLPFANR